MNNCILIGPTRTGTTSLFRTLAKLESFSPSTIKELNFFSSDLPVYKEYLSHFRVRESSQYTLEASPLYFSLTSKVADRINEFNSDTKLVVTLREPLSRFSSLVNHIFLKRNNGISSDQLNEMIRANLETPFSKEFVTNNLYNNLILHESNYLCNLKLWLESFSPDNIRVIFMESLTHQQYGEQLLLELFKWLDMDSLTDQCQRLSHDNSSRNVRFKAVHRHMMKINAAVEPMLNMYPGLREKLRTVYYCLNKDKNVTGYELDEQVMREVRQWISRENIGLKKICSSITLGAIPEWVS